MDADLTYRNEIISDSIVMRFPEYNFAEARSKAYGLYIQCEFSDNGQQNKMKLANEGLKVSESSECSIFKTFPALRTKGKSSNWI